MDYVEEIKKLNENICYKKGEIEYISLDLLLNQIATDDLSEFNNYDIKTAFLLQFDAFLREDMLLKKIRSVFNFNVKIMKKLPRSLILLSNQWMILRWKDDFFNNTYMIKEMKSFYQEILKLPEVMDYEELQIEKIIELLEQDNLFDAEVILQNLKNNKRHKGIHIKNEKLVSLRSTEYFNILVWPEMEIARQLSLYTHYQFSKIETKELLSSRWTKKNNYNDCPNVMSFSDRLNKIYLWVCEEILSYDKAKFRVQVWEKFLRIANSCRKINNFNDCCVIITALNSLPLKFMDKTKKRLSSDALNLFLELSNFISLENNYKLLREETKKTYGKPNIPFFGLYFRELAYIEEGPKYLNNGLINVVKIRRVGSILLELQEFKKNAYLFGKNNDLAFLSGPNPMTEDQLISLANKLGNFILYKRTGFYPKY